MIYNFYNTFPLFLSLAEFNNNFIQLFNFLGQ